MRSRAAIVLVTITLSAVAAAQTLTGTIRNGTTGKPAAHDDVVLLNLMQGMSEVARAQTDAQGRFSLKVDSQGPHLVRVNHQDVNYFRAAPPGTTSVEIVVYEAAKKLEGVTGTVDIMRLQTDNGALQVIDLYEVKNASNPPRTLMNDRPFEFYLPEGAKIDQAAAESPGGNPVNVSPVPAGEKNRYYVVFPIRPGETRFQIAYRLPYSGQAKIQPRMLLPYEHLAVVVPKSMQFTPDAAGTFSPMTDDTGATIQVVNNMTPARQAGFSVSGSGVLQDESGAAQGQAAQGGGQPMGPGGGLGAPIDTPDPLHQYRFAILGGICAVLIAGGFYVMTRQKPALAAAGARIPSNGNARAAARTDQSVMLLEALKEELFQLELDRQEDRISAEEYQKAKAALDQTIQRAVRRSG